MRKIKVFVSLGRVGCHREAEIKIPVDATDEEVEEAAQKQMFEMIDWGWNDAE